MVPCLASGRLWKLEVFPGGFIIAGGYVLAVLPLDWDLAGAIPVLPFGTLCPKDTFGLAIVSINAILVLPFGGGFF